MPSLLSVSTVEILWLDFGFVCLGTLACGYARLTELRNCSFGLAVSSQRFLLAGLAFCPGSRLQDICFAPLVPPP